MLKTKDLEEEISELDYEISQLNPSEGGFEKTLLLLLKRKNDLTSADRNKQMAKRKHEAHLLELRKTEEQAKERERHKNLVIEGLENKTDVFVLTTENNGIHSWSDEGIFNVYGIAIPSEIIDSIKIRYDELLKDDSFIALYDFPNPQKEASRFIKFLFDKYIVHKISLTTTLYTKKGFAILLEWRFELKL